MRLTDTPIAGAIDVLKQSAAVARAYDDLSLILRGLEAPRQRRIKSKASFIYDQTALIATARSSLAERGWRQGTLLSPGATFGRVRFPAVSGDMLTGGVHAIFEFGNRASYAYNLLIRVPLAIANASTQLTVLVVPSHEFGLHIDSNLVSFERVTFELSRLREIAPRHLPGPIMVMGLDP